MARPRSQLLSWGLVVLALPYLCLPAICFKEASAAKGQILRPVPRDHAGRACPAMTRTIMQRC